MRRGRLIEYAVGRPRICLLAMHGLLGLHGLIAHLQVGAHAHVLNESKLAQAAS